jgi:hypothetical protein
VPSLEAYKSIAANLVALLTNFMSSSALPTYSTGNMVATTFHNQARMPSRGQGQLSPFSSCLVLGGSIFMEICFVYIFSPRTDASAAG